MGHTGNISHAAANLHRIGRHNFTGASAFVGEGNQMGSAFLKIKITEEDPCAAPHLLVYQQVGFAARMIHRVVRIIAALLHRQIRDINAVIAFLRYIGSPGGYRYCTP